MKFESRNLKRYAEPISHELLEVGEVYFALRFVDEETLVPILEPIVFIGRNLARGDTDRVYFQDAVSYRDGVRYGPSAAEKGAEFSTGSTKAIFTYEKALDLLLACSLRRRGAGLV
jgi:hypothetical protein